MILEEYQNLLSNIVDKDFPIREAPLHFNYAMKLQISELFSDRHYCMLFPEFIEALSRSVDRWSPAPPNEPSVIHQLNKFIGKLANDEKSSTTSWKKTRKCNADNY